MSYNISQRWYKGIFVGLVCFVVQQINASVYNDFLPPPTQRAAEIVATIQEKKKLKTLTDDELISLTKEFQDEKTRSIEASEKDSKNARINYGPTAFVAANQFYIGATADKNNLTDVNDKTLVRASVMTTPGTAIMTLTPLAGNQVNINGTVNTGNNFVRTVSPLQNQAISALTLYNAMQPVASIVLPVPPVAKSSLNSIVILEDPFGGTSVTTNQNDTIQDATGTEITTAVTALAASSNIVFAAVPPANPANNVFGKAGSGIVRLQKGTPANKVTPGPTRDLRVISNTGTLGAGAAYAFDLKAFETTAPYVPKQDSVQFAFAPGTGGITEAELGQVVDMYWDNTLARLYIALSGATGKENAKGGVIALLVGRVNSDNTMTIEPAINLQGAGSVPLLTLDKTNQIIGFNATDAHSLKASLFKVRTMHTSTGRDYVIVNGGVETKSDQKKLNTQVYALPIVPASPTTAPTTLQNQAGLLAVQAPIPTNPFVVISAPNQLLTNDKSPAASVGLGNTFPTDHALPSVNQIEPVTDMQVIGDTVYISVAGDRSDDNKNAGIFASTALFDLNGIIRSWTPWIRVMGSTDVVQGFGIDEQTDNFWYLTTANGTPAMKYNTVKATQWGATESVNAGNASSYLATLFPQSKAGVHHVFSFSEKTPGFKQNEFSMAVAVGLDTVAMYQTGDKAAKNVLGLTSNIFSSSNVFVFNDPTVKALGPITCVEVSRNTNVNQGWVFIGGYNGVGVLSDPNGNGFNAAKKGLRALGSGATDFPGTGFTFKALSTTGGVNFSHTRKMQSDGTNLYVMTRDNLYVLPMSATSFGANPAPIAPVATINIPGVSLSDFVVSNKNIILATTNGLYVSAQLGTPTLVPNSPSSAIVQLQYLSESRGNPTFNGYYFKGNLYVLAADMSLSTGQLYRFDVDLSTNTPVINPIINNATPTIVGSTNGAIVNFNEFKGNAVTDGSFIFSELSKHFNEMYFVNMNPVDSLMLTYQITPMLGIPTSSYNVGMMIRDDASGAWIVPLDSGIRVNQ